MQSQLTKEYIWLLSTIRRASKISFEDINRRWLSCPLNPGGKPMSKKTFHYRIASLCEVFDVEIACDARDGYKYYIEEGYDAVSSLIKDAGIEALISQMGDEASASGSTLSAPCLFSDVRTSVILSAISHKHSLRFVYNNFAPSTNPMEHGTEVTVDPYFISYSTTWRQWLVVGHWPENNRLAAFCTRNLFDLEETDHPFSLPDGFDAQKCYDDLEWSVGLKGLDDMSSLK